MSHKMLEKDRPGKIFIGGLAVEVDEAVLEKEFSQFGRITEVLVIKDKVRKISRGFGFVTYENPIDAEDAVQKMDGKELKGKKLHVEDAVRGGTMSHDSSSRFNRDGGYSREGFSRGRSSRGGPPRGRGGPPRGRGGFPPEMGLHVMVLLVVDRDMEDVVGVSAEVVAAVEE
ncbi:hypothetical protein C0Q70_21139 [Pomacea canaliculata]|uniref:RRM domain-containing protein n=2 Tax=Pomacea canaliculata TaxID=400727 RepID=A0A2T7NBQ2_POMCA|nr:hypothetical protein C0Q70_21139 [Pomacea canaliculata]